MSGNRQRLGRYLGKKKTKKNSPNQLENGHIDKPDVRTEKPIKLLGIGAERQSILIPACMNDGNHMQSVNMMELNGPSPDGSPGYYGQTQSLGSGDIAGTSLTLEAGTLDPGSEDFPSAPVDGFLAFYPFPRDQTITGQPSCFTPEICPVSESSYGQPCQTGLCGQGPNDGDSNLVGQRSAKSMPPSPDHAYFHPRTGRSNFTLPSD